MEETEFEEFFSDVLELHLCEFCVKEEDIRRAVYQMRFQYRKEYRQLRTYLEAANFNAPAYRCAYLHKYAGFHAAMVDHLLSSCFKQTVMLRSIPRTNQVMNICCLGGGPGNDIIGLSNTLSHILHIKKFRLSVVDSMGGWASSFEAVLKVAQFRKYRHSVGTFLSGMLDKSYICDDLLKPISAKTEEALKSSDLVTMVKFVSAVKQNRALEMLKTVFYWMKLGAVVLFIDNAGGGFYKKASEAAFMCGLEEKCDPFEHEEFKTEGQFRFGSHSITSTKITAQMWMKTDSPSAEEIFILSERKKESECEEYNAIESDDPEGWRKSMLSLPPVRFPTNCFGFQYDLGAIDKLVDKWI